MSLDARLNKLIPALTARERGILVLRSLKDGSDADPLWRSTMPSSQRVEFNRLISLMNVCNIHLAALIIFIEGEVEKLELIEAWMFTLHLWQMNLAEIEFAASLLAREAIVESDHRRLVAKAEGQYVPIRELAKELAEDQRAWSDDDLEALGWTKALVVKDDAWQRLCKEAEQEIGRAVAAGELEAKGRGQALRVRRASFDASMGRAVTVYPDWAGGYEVLPDDRLPHVTSARDTLALLQEALHETPLDRVEGADIPDELRGLEGLIQTLQRKMQYGLALRWTEIVAVERIVAEIAAEFDGEDPLKPANRASVEATKASIQRMATVTGGFGQPVQLTEPSDQDLEETRALVERGRRLFG